MQASRAEGLGFSVLEALPAARRLWCPRSAVWSDGPRRDYGLDCPPGDAARWLMRSATCSIARSRRAAALPRAARSSESDSTATSCSRGWLGPRRSGDAMTAAPCPERWPVLHDMAEEGWPSMDQMGHLLTTRCRRSRRGFRSPIRHRLQRSSRRAAGRVRPRSSPIVSSTGWCSIRGASAAVAAASTSTTSSITATRSSRSRCRRSDHGDLPRHRHVPSLVEPRRPSAARSVPAMTRRILRGLPARRARRVRQRSRARRSGRSSSPIRRGCGWCRTASIPPCSRAAAEAARARAARTAAAAARRVRRAARRQRHSRASGWTG